MTSSHDPPQAKFKIGDVVKLLWLPTPEIATIKYIKRSHREDTTWVYWVDSYPGVSWREEELELNQCA